MVNGPQEGPEMDDKGLGGRKSAISFLGNDTGPNPWRIGSIWGTKHWGKGTPGCGDSMRQSLEGGELGCVCLKAGGAHGWLKADVRLERSTGPGGKKL